MPSSAVRTFTDPDQFADAIRGSSVQITVTERGDFSAKITQVDLPRVWMLRFSETLPRIFNTTPPAGRAVLSFLTQPTGSLIRSGVELTWDRIARLPVDNTFDARTLGPISTGTMSLPVADMVAFGEAMIGSAVHGSNDLIVTTPPSQALLRLRRLHEAASSLAEDAPIVLAQPDAARGLEQAMIEAMLICLGDGETGEDRAALRRHAAIMRRFHRLIAQHMNEPLYLPELCKEIGTSLRTLNACCHEHLGMGPKRYLLLRRMYLFRRALRDNSSAHSTVTEIATRYGFWQFGRLAVEYRAIFGEAPSATLARPV